MFIKKIFEKIVIAKMSLNGGFSTWPLDGATLIIKNTHKFIVQMNCA